MNGGRLTREKHLQCDVKDSLIRLSSGIENAEDILNNLKEAFAPLIVNAEVTV